MGWEEAYVKVVAHMSKHNSDRDDEDRALWGDLVSRIAALCSEPQYEQIRPWVL